MLDEPWIFGSSGLIQMILQNVICSSRAYPNDLNSFTIQNQLTLKWELIFLWDFSFSFLPEIFHALSQGCAAGRPQKVWEVKTNKKAIQGVLKEASGKRWHLREYTGVALAWKVEQPQHRKGTCPLKNALHAGREAPGTEEVSGHRPFRLNWIRHDVEWES